MLMQMTISTLHAHRVKLARNWILAAGLLLASNLLAVALWQAGYLQAQENHFLEQAQGGFLALVCCVCSLRAWRLKKTALTLKFLLHAGLALLSYSFLLREVDIDRFGTAQGWAQLEQALRLFGVALWIALLMFVAPRVTQLWPQRSIMFAMPMVQLTMLGGALLVASWPFDKQIFPVLSYATSQFIEEMLELNGCMILFFGSLAD
jgi:hypothetical protein